MRMNLFSAPEGAKMSLFFLDFGKKKEANWSANDFSDLWHGSFTSETLFRVLCSVRHSFLES